MRDRRSHRAVDQEAVRRVARRLLRANSPWPRWADRRTGIARQDRCAPRGVTLGARHCTRSNLRAKWRVFVEAGEDRALEWRAIGANFADISNDNLILRRPRSGRLEGWATHGSWKKPVCSACLVATLRDAPLRGAPQVRSRCKLAPMSGAPPATSDRRSLATSCGSPC